jgi:hypothetical protein
MEAMTSAACFFVMLCLSAMDDAICDLDSVLAIFVFLFRYSERALKGFAAGKQEKSPIDWPNLSEFPPTSFFRFRALVVQPANHGLRSVGMGLTINQRPEKSRGGKSARETDQGSVPTIDNPSNRKLGTEDITTGARKNRGKAEILKR